MDKKEKETRDFAKKMTELTEDLPKEISQLENQKDLDDLVNKYKQIFRENLSYEELISNAVMTALNVAKQVNSDKSLFLSILKAALKEEKRDD